MTKEQIERAIKVLDCDEADYTRYEGYSGKGMYGEKTLGLVVDNDEGLVDLILEEEKKVTGKYMRTDSLGLRVIIY